MNTFQRLQRLLRVVGWGPADQVTLTIAFARSGDGWIVGNGIIRLPWRDKPVPTDRMQALYEMEVFYNQEHIQATGHSLVPDLELLSRLAELSREP